MASRTRTRGASLTTRRCLACGYAGRFAQGRGGRGLARFGSEPTASDRSGPLGHCPRCGCDFHARPPRSYAEMEGLDQADRPELDADAQESRLVERWLGFLFIAAIAVIALGSLSAALVAPFAR
jgi:hypothetical protein